MKTKLKSIKIKLFSQSVKVYIYGTKINFVEFVNFRVILLVLYTIHIQFNNIFPATN